MLKREHPFPEDDAERTLVGVPAPLHLPARPSTIDDEPEDIVIVEIPWWEAKP